MTPDDVIKLFSRLDLNDAESRYLNGQARRLAYLTNIVQRYCSKASEPKRILDIGPHFFTRCLLESVEPTPAISTLGYAYPKLVPLEMLHSHASLDVNECGHAALPFAPASFDIITICEVIEHLFIPPDVVFSFLNSLIKAPGGIIIVGTPNAVSLSKRLKMMMGKNPFQRLSPTYRDYQTHIREYTMEELYMYGQKSNISVIFSEYCDYWDQYEFPRQSEISELERDVLMFRAGLTVIYTSQTSALA